MLGMKWRCDDVESNSISVLARAGGKGAIGNYHDGNANVVLPVGAKFGDLPEDGEVRLAVGLHSRRP